MAQGYIALNISTMTRLFLFAICCCSIPAFAQIGANPKEILNETHVENAYPRLSADGKQMLYQSNRTGKWQLFIMDLQTRKQTRITNDNYNNNLPDWSGDGKHIAFVSDRDGNEEIYLMSSDGSGMKRLTNSSGRDIHPYFSPNGRYLLFNSTRANSSLDIFRMELATGKTEQITNTANEEETCARYSHDMKRIVFLRNSEIADDIYIMDMGTKTIRNLTNSPHVEHGWPVFSPDDKWVYYSSRAKKDYAIYRQNIDGNIIQQVTEPGAGHDDARPYVSTNNKTLIYNKTTGKGIAIYSLELS